MYMYFRCCCFTTETFLRLLMRWICCNHSLSNPNRHAMPSQCRVIPYGVLASRFLECSYFCSLSNDTSGQGGSCDCQVRIEVTPRTSRSPNLLYRSCFHSPRWNLSEVDAYKNQMEMQCWRNLLLGALCALQ